MARTKEKRAAIILQKYARGWLVRHKIKALHTRVSMAINSSMFGIPNNLVQCFILLSFLVNSLSLQLVLEQ